MQTVTWPEVAHRIVEVQQNLRLCIKRDLTEHDIVSRIMRRDNYLIGAPPTALQPKSLLDVDIL